MSSSNMGGLLQGHGVGIIEEERAAPDSELIKVHSGEKNSPDEIRLDRVDTEEVTFRGGSVHQPASGRIEAVQRRAFFDIAGLCQNDGRCTRSLTRQFEESRTEGLRRNQGLRPRQASANSAKPYPIGRCVYRCWTAIFTAQFARAFLIGWSVYRRRTATFTAKFARAFPIRR